MRTPDRATKPGARALERLASDIIGWLTTINPDGQPQSSPVWFVWADEQVLVYSHKRAPRNGNLADRPLVAFNLNTDADGDDVATMEGVATIDGEAPPASANPMFVAKYRRLFDAYGWTPEYYAGEYPVVVRITPTRWRVA
jgi:PPOX class probable F420-dependent enzyme